MKRVECTTCNSPFKSRFGEQDEPTCPACRMGDREQRDPPELDCPVCGEETPTDREIRSLSGQSFEGRICITDAGYVMVHPGADE